MRIPWKVFVCKEIWTELLGQEQRNYICTTGRCYTYTERVGCRAATSMWEWVYILPGGYQHPLSIEITSTVVVFSNESRHHVNEFLWLYRRVYLPVCTPLQTQVYVGPEWSAHKVPINVWICCWKQLRIEIGVGNSKRYVSIWSHLGNDRQEVLIISRIIGRLALSREPTGLSLILT